MEGKRKLIAFIVLVAAIVTLHYIDGPAAPATTEKLIYLFLGFVGANGYEHWLKKPGRGV